MYLLLPGRCPFIQSSFPAKIVYEAGFAPHMILHHIGCFVYPFFFFIYGCTEGFAAGIYLIILITKILADIRLYPPEVCARQSTGASINLW